MKHLQFQVVFKRIEVAVAMEQLMTVFNTECSDEAVNRLADGEALPSECSVVLRGSDGEFSATTVEDWKLKEIPAKLAKAGIRSRALQNFAENETRQADFLMEYCVL